MATLRLALNLALWSVPPLVGTSALAHFVAPDTVPPLPEVLAAAEPTAGPVPSLPDALIQLIGAESEALEVAWTALQPGPTPDDLATRANHAAARVLDAARNSFKAF